MSSTVTKRFVLRDNEGAALHFDIDVDLFATVLELRSRAMHNRSRKAVVAGGAVVVTYVGRGDGISIPEDQS